MAVLLHLLLAFPGGHLEARRAGILVIAGYVDTLIVAGCAELFRPAQDEGVRNLALIHADTDVADALSGVAAAVGFVLFALGIVVLSMRWRRASAPSHRAFAPVLWSGLAAAFAVALLLVFAAAGAEARVAQGVALVVFAAVPFAFLLGLVRSRLGRGAVADLVVELGAPSAPGVREALARALGDPALAVAYWLPERSRYADTHGRPMELPAPGGERAATVIDRNGHRIAALVHDAALLERPQLIDAACAAAGLALENERLHAELAARLVELQASRARIVEAGDEARRQHRARPARRGAAADRVRRAVARPGRVAADRRPPTPAGW